MNRAPKYALRAKPASPRQLRPRAGATNLRLGLEEEPRYWDLEIATAQVVAFLTVYSAFSFGRKHALFAEAPLFFAVRKPVY